MNSLIITGSTPDIQITSGDLDILETLLGKLEGKRSVRTVAFLRSEIERATVVEEAASQDFVRLGSTVLFRDDTGHTHRNTLTVPGDATPRPDGLSVMTVMGAALLGLRSGQRMTYETPDGRIRGVCVLEVTSGAGSRHPDGKVLPSRMPRARNAPRPR